MLIKASKEITDISNNQAINSSNYIESIKYINNLYSFVSMIKKYIATKDFTFMPTFRGALTCERFGLPSSEVENEMKRFVIRSELFLEDKCLRDTILREMGKLCKSVFAPNAEMIEFILE